MKYLTNGRSIWRDPATLKHRSENPRNGHTEDTAKDRKEILAYVAVHPGCSRFDIELTCFQGRSAVLEHLAALQREGSIEVVRDSYQVVGSRCSQCGGQLDFNRVGMRHKIYCSVKCAGRKIMPQKRIRPRILK